MPKAANSLAGVQTVRSEEHTSELQSQSNLVCRLLLEKKKNRNESVRTRKDNTVNNLHNVESSLVQTIPTKSKRRGCLLPVLGRDPLGAVSTASDNITT